MSLPNDDDLVSHEFHDLDFGRPKLQLDDFVVNVFSLVLSHRSTSAASH
jgi:hypothetical protein